MQLRVTDYPTAGRVEYLEPVDGANRVYLYNLAPRAMEHLRDVMWLNRGTPELLNLRSVARAHMTEFDKEGGQATLFLYGENHRDFLYALLTPLGLQDRV